MADAAELVLFDAIEDYVARTLEHKLEPLLAQIAELRAKVAAQPEPKAAEVDYGKVAEIVQATVAPAIAAMPKPEPAKAADVDYDRVGEVIHLAVAKEVAKIPPAAPGKNADPVDYALVKEFAHAAAVTALASLPKPKDGDSVTLDDVRPLVEAAVAAIPRPGIDEGSIAEKVLARVVIPEPQPGPPGKVDHSELAAMVEDAVKALPPGLTLNDVRVEAERIAAAAVSAIPAPVAPAKGLDASEVEAIAIRVATARFEAVPKGLDAEAVLQIIGERVPDLVQLPEMPDTKAFLTRDDAQMLVEKAVADAVRALPPPEPGKSVEPAHVQAMVDAAVAKMLADLPKPKDGEPVHPDTVALMVRDAVAQTVEKTIASIPVPRNGRDALDLEILDGIDPRKSYPAGTFALHDGGTVLALRDTDPLETVDGVVSAGWKVTQDGIKEVLREETDDERMTRVVVLATSGRRFAVDCVTASGMKDQGVYRPGMKYRAGDCVTFDESYWVARHDTQKPPPGEGWRLILKGKRR